jgi:integrase
MQAFPNVHCQAQPRCKVKTASRIYFVLNGHWLTYFYGGADMASEHNQARKKKYRPGERVRYGWKTELSDIIVENNRRNAGGDRNVGTRTRHARIETLYQGFGELRQLGYKIENPRNFKELHMRALVAHWESKGLAPATIQNRISVFRIFAEWIGKNNMIKKSELYCSAPEVVKRSQVAQEDKSWSAKDIDIPKLLLEIEAYSKHAAAQLLMIHAFGLRRNEALCFKPNLNWTIENGVNLIRVRDGPKGGRERVLIVETPQQEAALLYAKQVAGKQKKSAIGYPDLTLKQAEQRYNYIMRKFGLTKAELRVTGHGLRHQFANNRYEQLSGLHSPVRGGEKPSGEDIEADIHARYRVSEELGHSRLSVTAAYYGSHQKGKKPKAGDTHSQQDEAL